MTITAHEDQYAPDVSDPEEDQAWEERKAQLDREKAEKVREWDGDGLPPIKHECESKIINGGTRKGWLTYASEKLEVWKDSETHDEYATRPGDRVYRPITRTDRERWIEAARNAMVKHCGTLADQATPADVLSVIYDAGLAHLPE